MNIPITLLSLFCLFGVLGKRFKITRRQKLLVYLGVLAPLVDLVRLASFNFQGLEKNGYYFHSFFYHALFWSVVVILHYSYSKRPKVSLQFFLPLAGLSWYFFFTLFSTDYLIFFSPFSLEAFRLNWVATGYLIPFIVMGIILLSKKWSKQGSFKLSVASLAFLGFFLAVGGLSRLTIYNSLDHEFKTSGSIRILPDGILPFSWTSTSYADGEYLLSRFSLFDPSEQQTKTLAGTNDIHLARSVLTDPEILRYYRSFQNPVVQNQVLNNQLSIEIEELFAVNQLFWMRRILVLKNQKQRTLNKKTGYSLLFWEVN